MIWWQLQPIILNIRVHPLEQSRNLQHVKIILVPRCCDSINAALTEVDASRSFPLFQYTSMFHKNGDFLSVLFVVGLSLSLQVKVNPFSFHLSLLRSEFVFLVPSPNPTFNMCLHFSCINLSLRHPLFVYLLPFHYVGICWHFLFYAIESHYLSCGCGTCKSYATHIVHRNAYILCKLNIEGHAKVAILLPDQVMRCNSFIWWITFRMWTWTRRCMQPLTLIYAE